MVEKYEFQVFTKYLSLVGVADPPQSASRIAVTVRGTVGDSTYLRIGELADRLHPSGLSPFGGWEIHRSYSVSEIDRATLFMIKVPLTHLAAEECGTQYDESGTCEECGIGSKQVGSLRVSFHKVSRVRDIVRLWSGELIVSDRLASLIESGGFSGALLPPVAHSTYKPAKPIDLTQVAAGRALLSIAAQQKVGSSGWPFFRWLHQEAQRPLYAKALEEWKQFLVNRKNRMAHAATEKDAVKIGSGLRQMIVKSGQLDLAEGSSFGSNPFGGAAKGNCSCNAGEIAGLRPISPLRVKIASWDGSDICRTGVHMSSRGGLFRPFQILVVSRRFIQALRQEGMKGFKFEVVDTV